MSELVYSQLGRGGRHRWWRPLVVLIAGLVGSIGPIIVMLLGVVAVGLARSGSLDGVSAAADALGDDRFDATDLLVTNLFLASFVPLALGATALGFWRRPGLLSSVAGRLRWRWLGIAAAVALVWYLLVNVTLTVLSGEDLIDHPEPQWRALVLIVLVTTPLQCAGEEYAFRGWLGQSLGSWFARPLVSVLVSSVASAAVFGLAHGTQNGWLYADRFAFGLIASLLAWRTGGLEAGIALHSVNNVVAFGLATATGSLSESATAESAPALSTIIDLGMLVPLVAVLLWLAHRMRLQRTAVPAPVRDRWGAWDTTAALPTAGTVPVAPEGLWGAPTAARPVGGSPAPWADGGPWAPSAAPHAEPGPWVAPAPSEPALGPSEPAGSAWGGSGWVSPSGESTGDAPPTPPPPSPPPVTEPGEGRPS